MQEQVADGIQRFHSHFVNWYSSATLLPGTATPGAAARPRPPAWPARRGPRTRFEVPGTLTMLRCLAPGRTSAPSGEYGTRPGRLQTYVARRPRSHRYACISALPASLIDVVFARQDLHPIPPDEALESAAVSELPAGTVTFLFSDIEGSTRLLQRLGERWGDVLDAHNRILRAAFEAGGGREVDRQGDAFFAVFARARHALAAAAQAQRELAAHEWPDGVELRVRMGIHTGEPGLHDEGYLGLDVVRAARISAVAHGGQVLVSETTAALVRGEGVDGLELDPLGEHRLKDLEQPERLFQLVIPGTRSDFPPPKTGATEPRAPDVRRATPADWESHADELTVQALAAVRQIDVSSLSGLGERIERQVQATLAQRGLPSGLGSRRSAMRALVWLALVAALVVAAVVVLVVKLA
jgi:class 3 adenylate cyclase